MKFTLFKSSEWNLTGDWMTMNIIEYLQIFSCREEEKEEEATLHCILAEWRRVVTQYMKESKDHFYLLHVN